MATVGSVTADAGWSLALRMDHGTQYLSDHFLNQLKHRVISPSFAFIEQPQTNGVAERFLRTLKEQVIYGRIFQNLQRCETRSGTSWTPTTGRGWWEKMPIKAPGKAEPSG